MKDIKKLTNREVNLAIVELVTALVRDAPVKPMRIFLLIK
jgi:hypothetical protein